MTMNSNAPAATGIEKHGIEPISAADRSARPLDLFRLVFGGANTFATEPVLAAAN